MICRIGSVVALFAFFLPWVSSPFLSIGYGLSGSIDQAELNGGKLFEMLGQSQLTLDGRTETVTGGPTLSYGMPLIILCLLFSLGISFYRSRSPVAERNIAAAVLGTGVLCTLVVVIACAVYWANFKPPTFGNQRVGYFSIRYGAICSLLANIAIVIGSYIMLTVARANFAAPPEPSDSAEASASLLTALNRCDVCGTVFPNFYYLTKVDGKGFLCEKCREVT
jgi:hypothetical protein